jgi:hypothetical protein
VQSLQGRSNSSRQSYRLSLFVVRFSVFDD